MWLDTYAFQARAFYERRGFQPTGRVERWEGGEATELYLAL